MGPFILGVIGAMMLTISVMGDLTKDDVLLAEEAKKLIEVCEKDLPRTQTCVLVAVPKE